MSNKRQTPADEPFFIIRSAASDLPSGFVLERHSHTWPQLIYASAGVMTVWTESGSWIAPPNWAVWAPAGVKHGIRFSGKSAMRTLYVRPSDAASLPHRCAVIGVSPLLRELVIRTVAVGMLDERIPSQVAMARLILDEILERPTPALDLTMPFAPAARQVAEAILGEDRSIALHNLARRAGLSPRTLERRFVEQTGMTLGRWRRQARLLDALRELASGQAVKAVAERAGYSNPSAFVVAFRAVFGVTPARYFAPIRAEDRGETGLPVRPSARAAGVKNTRLSSQSN